MAFNWRCGHCGGAVTITDQDYRFSSTLLQVGTADVETESVRIVWDLKRCPNPECNKFSLQIGAGFCNRVIRGNKYEYDGLEGLIPSRPVGIGQFRFSPRVGAPLSANVPAVVTEDFEEACSIKDLSPKAAATLCRRALQGMVRDFWGVHEKTLHEELKKIESSCDQDLFRALMGIKSIGNIGAHPEKDINLIVDVEEGEVDALIEVLRILDGEWYVARAVRAERLSKVHALGASKAAAKSVTAAASHALPSAS